MNLLDSLKQHIANTLAAEKSYNLPALCTGLGRAPCNDSESFASKYKYVLRRVQTLAKDEALALAKQVLQRFSSYQLQETLDLLVPLDGVIPAITRRNLIDKLSDTGDLHGRLYINEFLERTFPLSQIPYDDYRFPNLEEAVAQHMIRNDDWSYKNFLECADYLQLSERRLRAFLEQIVHPEVQTGDDQKRFVDIINPYLQRDGFELQAVEEISGYPPAGLSALRPLHHPRPAERQPACPATHGFSPFAAQPPARRHRNRRKTPLCRRRYRQPATLRHHGR